MVNDRAYLGYFALIIALGRYTPAYHQLPRVSLHNYT